MEGPSWQRAHWDVRRVKCLQCQVPAIPCEGLQHLRWQWFQPSLPTIDACGTRAVVEAWIADGTLPADFDICRVVACSLPSALAKLTSHGRMGSVCMSLSRRFPRNLVALRPVIDLRSVLQVPDPKPCVVLNRDVFAHLTDALESWLPDLVSCAQTEEQREETTMELRRFHTWALQCAFSLSPANIRAHRVVAGGKFARRALVGRRREKPTAGQAVTGELHGRYASWFVLHSVLLCHHLLQDADMGKVLELSIRCAFPPEVARQLLQLLEGMPVPHAASISRWRLQVDVAFMLWQRKQHAAMVSRDDDAGDIPLYVLSDSSPQGGRDWLLTETHVAGLIKTPMETFEVACTLICRLQAMREASDRDITEDAKLEIDRLASELQSSFAVEVSPPVGLGYRHTDTIHKAHALTHQLFLLIGPGRLQGWIRRIASLTTDFGVESGLTKHKYHLGVLCPHAATMTFQDEGGDADGNEDQYVDFTTILHVPGALHAIHNTCKDVTGAMPNFPSMQTGMRALANFLKDKHLREALVATCFSSHDSRLFAHRFRTFSAALLDWRWASICDFLSEIEPMERSLRRFWDLGAFQSGRHSRDQAAAAAPDADPEVEASGARMHAFATAMANHELWCYMRMLREVMSVLSHMMFWVQGCPCHLHPQAAEDLGDRMPKVCISDKCPLRGRRAPELACGELDRFMEELREFFGMHLVEVIGGLPADAQARISSDYHAGIQHLSFMLQVKFSYWGDLPYALCGVAHASSHTARSAAHSCLAKFEDAVARRGGDTSGMHCLTAQWLSPGRLRDQLVLFAQGVSRDDPRLATLRHHCARLMFIPIIERSVEGRHSEVKRATLHARHHSGAYISCRLRLKELLAHADKRPEVLEEIAQQLDSCRLARWVLHHIGLSAHPALAHIAGETPDALADKVVYRLDAATQFADMKHSIAGNGPAGGQPPDPIHLADRSGLLRWAALEHFHDTVDRNSWFLARIPQPGDAPVNLPFQSLVASISQSRVPTVAIADDGQILQIEDEAGDTRVTRSCEDVVAHCPAIMYGGELHRLALFRISHLKPSVLRRACGDTTAQLRSSDIAITLYEIEGVDMENYHLTTSGVPSGGQGALSSALGVINESLFHARILSFPGEPAMVRSLPSIGDAPSDVVEAVTQKLVAASALPNSDKHLLVNADSPGAVAHVAYLRACESQGLVTCQAEADDATSWVLTAQGLAALRLKYLLHGPDHVLKCRDLPDRNEWTRFELLSYLQTHGWAILAWQKGARRPPDLAVEIKPDAVIAFAGEVLPASAFLVFRPHHATVSWEYLRAMVAIEVQGSMLCAQSAARLHSIPLPLAIPGRIGFEGLVFANDCHPESRRASLALPYPPTHPPTQA